MFSASMFIVGSLFGLVVVVVVGAQSAQTISVQDEWAAESKFCDQLDKLNVGEDKLCDCSYNYDNMLELVCGPSSHRRSSVSISKELTLVFHLLQHLDQNISLGTLMFTNLTNLVALDFTSYDRLQVGRLSLVGLPALDKIAVSSTMHDTLAHVDIIDVAPKLWSDALSTFLDHRFTMLHSLLMSMPFNAGADIAVELKMIKPSADKCSSIRRLSLNFHCLPNVQLSVLPANLLSSLCNIEALDLSCLQLQAFANLNEVAMLRTNATDTNAKAKIFVNLSRNRLKDAQPIINEFHHLPVLVEVLLDNDKTLDAPSDVRNIVLPPPPQ